MKSAVHPSSPPFILIFLIILLLPLASVSVLILSPSLVQISNHYQISQDLAESVITVTLLGYAFGPLLYGPIITRYGKRHAALIGIVIFSSGILLSLGSFYSLSFKLLEVGRAVTGIGAVAGMVIAYNVISESYDEIKAKKIYSRLAILFCIIPSLAVWLGGYFTDYLRWDASFYFLLFYGVLCIIFSFLSPLEKSFSSVEKTNFQALFQEYVQLIKNKEYMSYISLGGISTAIVYVHAAKMPLIAIHQIGLSSYEFSLFNIIPYVGATLALLFYGRYGQLISHPIMLFSGCLLMLFGSLFILIQYLFLPLNSFLLFMGAFIIFCGSAPILPNSLALSTRTVQNKALAASFTSFFYMTLASLLTWFSSFIRSDLDYPLAILILIVFSIGVYFAGIYKRQKKALS